MFDGGGKKSVKVLPKMTKEGEELLNVVLNSRSLVSTVWKIWFISSRVFFFS